MWHAGPMTSLLGLSFAEAATELQRARAHTHHAHIRTRAAGYIHLRAVRQSAGTAHEKDGTAMEHYYIILWMLRLYPYSWD
ncbi:uncharacterized protein SEPMUDRAFT_148201 [Sphaerulina musiva SO2202]|uniref:Secreted protein n=1 Tax=Sphaerulina musiva (strain SO2202) TaxID=692275 RepID=M3C2M1_SPHMS|nr:uncharacterized protein SEPMUDRAFT_148201 [Sphaerulina musiva SO2202]EMF14506.1 hypothetical protein SEPMUDRAFT_148201 [Sphaerulina musiva SO2202]